MSALHCKKNCETCVDGRCARDVFPAFLKLCHKKVLVVGGGRMAAEKLPALLEAGAEVTVVSPEVRDEVRTLTSRIELRPFRVQDLEGVWYVVAAAPPAINRQVGEAADRRQIFVNAVDDVRTADVYLGSVIRRAGMTLAISSNGAAPALTALIRRGLETLLPSDLAGWRELAQDARRDWKRDQVPFEARRPLLLEAINRWYQADGAHGGRSS